MPTRLSCLIACGGAHVGPLHSDGRSALFLNKVPGAPCDSRGADGRKGECGSEFARDIPRVPCVRREHVKDLLYEEVVAPMKDHSRPQTAAPQTHPRKHEANANDHDGE